MLFVSFDGLHDFTHTKDAYRTIKELNLFLNELDRLCEQNKVEKIKTNPFLVVSGCPEENPRHAEVLLGLARKFFAFVKVYKQEQKSFIQIKIGIHRWNGMHCIVAPLLCQCC